MDLRIRAQGVNAIPGQGQFLEVDLFGADCTYVDVAAIVDSMGPGVFLEVIGKEAAMKYWGLLRVVKQEEAHGVG